MPFSSVKKFLGPVSVLFFSVLPIFSLKAADHQRIEVIEIRAGQYVDNLAFFGRVEPSGPRQLLNQFGGSGGEKHVVSFEPDEYLTGVFGKRGSVLDSIGFVTNKRIYGPYGGDGGHISFKKPELNIGRWISTISGTTGHYMEYDVVKDITGVSFDDGFI